MRGTSIILARGKPPFVSLNPPYPNCVPLDRGSGTLILLPSYMSLAVPQGRIPSRLCLVQDPTVLVLALPPCVIVNACDVERTLGVFFCSLSKYSHFSLIFLDFYSTGPVMYPSLACRTWGFFLLPHMLRQVS